MERQITKQTARRFVLGRQGLWPGRRWRGKAGADTALRQAEAVQIDPISVIARSHEIVLHSRVEAYDSAHLETLLFEERRFFDYGSILMLYPMAELPHWQAVMRRWEEERRQHPYWTKLRDDEDIFEVVREGLRTRGPLGSRDFTERARIPGGFNTIKDTAQALYYLWMSGELMTHRRRNFDRIYDFFENVTGHPFSTVNSTPAEAEAFFACKGLRDTGLATTSEWARRVTVYQHRRPAQKEARATLDTLTESGEAARVQVEGRKEACYLPAEDLPLLDQLEKGEIPAAWKSVAKTTEEEITFLAPLDNVIWDRARAKAVFDFEYLWEVYKPLEQRRWGYYTLPILYGDRLAARMAFRLERKTATLRVEGFWAEEETRTDDTAFLSALAAGLSRFACFHDARKIDLAAVEPPALREKLDALIL